MADEYIKRDAAVAFLENMAASRYLIQCFANKDRFPAADVAPIEHGEWVPIVSYFHGKPTGKYYCSVCHRVETMKGIYCRLCGARMDGGNKNV